MPPRNLVVIAIAAILGMTCYSVATKNRYATMFAEALDVVDKQALQDVPREKLFTSAMDGMMKTLDEHSMYLSGDVFTALDEDMKQQFGGVGMYVENDPTTDELVVVAPIPETPAYEAGIKIGDVILEIEGQSTVGMDRSDAVKIMRGPQGTDVSIVLGRGDAQLPIVLTRAAIPIPSVHGDFRTADGKWHYNLEKDPKIGYIRLLQFGRKSTEEIQAALQEINGNVDALILDLRNNTGGLLTAAIEISDMFIDGEKSIVRTRGRGKQVLDEHFASSGSVLPTGIPMVVLVNRHSASASEILSACLQDHGRAIVVGEQTWGKGTVQNLIPIQRGKSALKLTIASFWRPNDQNIDRFDPQAEETGVWGVRPDDGMAIELTEEEVFENIRERNIRDLIGLNPEIVNKLADQRRKARAAEKAAEQKLKIAPGTDVKETAEDTDEKDTAEKEGQSHIHLDRPLERARQHLKTILAKPIAA